MAQPQPVSPVLQHLYDALRLREEEGRGTDEQGYLDFQHMDLHGENLIGLNLTKCDFTGCNFARASMIKTILDECQLHACIFTGANLSHASVERVTADNTDFSGANCFQMKATSGTFRRANFANASLRFANFTRSILTQATFGRDFADAREYADCTGARFECADCTDVDFCDVELDQSSFRHATLIWTKFMNNEDTMKIDFHGAIWEKKQEENIIHD